MWKRVGGKSHALDRQHDAGRWREQGYLVRWSVRESCGNGLGRTNIVYCYSVRRRRTSAALLSE